MIDKEIKTYDACCTNCKHYLGQGRCKAFDTIPADVFLPLRPHDKPLEGQRGSYTFEPREVHAMRVYAD